MCINLLSSRPHSPRARIRSLARLILVNVSILILFFILMEGSLSALLFAWGILNVRVAPERYHTRFDRELGSVAVPNLDLPNMYGPGVSLRTNSQDFRGSREFTELVAPGRRRVICSGDSVTFGFGVDDDHSWCRLLESLDGRLEAVNMALPGYGVDQAYGPAPKN